MKEKRTIIYEGLGFPITLVDVPIEISGGEEILDIDLSKLQERVFRYLIYKPAPLTGKQLRFIRKFLEMSTTEFGKKFGVTHPTVLKWEKEKSPIDPTAEFCIRLFALKHLQDSDLKRLCDEITVEKLLAERSKKESAIQIDEQQLIAC